MDEYFTPEDHYSEQYLLQAAELFEEWLNSGTPFYLDVQTAVDLADHYHQADQNDKCLLLMEYMLDMRPDAHELHYRMAAHMLDMEQLAHAMHHAQQALDACADNTDYLTLKARILYETDGADDAIALLEQAIDYADDTAELMYRMGQLHFYNQAYTKAFGCYTLALKEDPAFDEVLYELMASAEAADMHDEGMRCLKAYLDDNPYNATAWYNLGMLYLKLDLFEQAISAFDFAIVIQDDFISAHHGKAAALCEIGRFQDAIKVFLEVMHHDRRDLATLLGLGECYLQLENPARAGYYYRKAMEQNENLPDAWCGLAACLEDMGHWLEAVRHYRRAIELSPEYMDAWSGLAVCEYELGNAVSAMEALRTAIKLDPSDIELWEEWAQRLDEMDMPDAAMNLIEESMRHNPEVTSLGYRFAGYAFKSGKAREGFRVLENTLLTDYDSHGILYEVCPEIKTFQPVQDMIDMYRL